MEIVFVVAVAENGVIGAAGAIPWRLKSDMRRFRALTIGKPLVMGRKTFVSMRRPLPGRDRPARSSPRQSLSYWCPSTRWGR